MCTCRQERYRRIQNLRVQRGERDRAAVETQHKQNVKNVREMKRQEQERIDARNQERLNTSLEAVCCYRNQYHRFYCGG